MHDTIRQERFRVVSAWLDLRVAEQAYQIAEANLAHANQVQDKARLRFKIGDLSGANLWPDVGYSWWNMWVTTSQG